MGGNSKCEKKRLRMKQYFYSIKFTLVSLFDTVVFMLSTLQTTLNLFYSMIQSGNLSFLTATKLGI